MLFFVRERFGFGVALFSLCAGICGCAGQKDLVLRLYRDRFNCSSPKVREIAKGLWEAQGCGYVLRRYDCSTEPGVLETKIMCREKPLDEKPAAIRLVEQMHRTQYGCNAVSVWPVDGTSDLYEARGCGPTLRYRCRNEAESVFCKAEAQVPSAAQTQPSGTPAVSPRAQP